MLMISAVLLTVFSERATEYARDSLKVCALCVIPSLFPYMVISRMIVTSRACDFIGRFLPVSRLFGLPSAASASIILGALCGFPVGAKSAVSMYEGGLLSKTEAEVLISYSNNTGPSFVVAVIGAGLWQSERFGWELYFFQLISAVVGAGVVNHLIFPFKRETKESNKTALKSPELFRSVADSTQAVLTVCGFIVFFSVVCGFLLPAVSAVSEKLSVLVCCLFEFTGGARLAAAVGGAAGRFLTGLCVGFSGISVFCQTAAFTSPAGLSLKRTVLSKSLQGVICGTLCVLFSQCRDTAQVGGLYEEASLLLSLDSPLKIALLSLFCYFFVIKNELRSHKM